MGEEVLAAADRDEEVALLDPARVDLHSRHLVGPGTGDEPPERLDLVEGKRNHWSPLRSTQGRTDDLAVIEGHLAARELLLGLGAAARDHDDITGGGLADGALDRRTAVELELEPRRLPA